MPYVSSSSSSSLPQGYDVFMSFRGEDTRTSFTSHLYDALIRNDITTYKDDKTLEIGNPIASELLEAIEASRIAIVVLSSNFATSKWCLEEISKIVDCMEHSNLAILPVFYHVDPSDVRRLRNCFEQGFVEHEANPEISPQMVKTWRNAFKTVGALSGIHVTQDRNETEVISEIVAKILKDMPDALPKDLFHGLVGMESRVDEIKRIFRMESSEVLFVGICGMSGIGKTTLAESVFYHIQRQFEKSSFIENIKDISKQEDSTDLCKLQQKLLDDILKEKSVRVQSVKHGQTLLGTKLRGLKVIIVLDDVNHVDQLTYLAGGREWFGPGTRIIVTTTNIDLLNVHKIIEIYRCEEMKNDEALRLFSQSAFEHGPPTHVYEKWSDDIVKLAGGLPLALNVYGSLLYKKEESYWKEMLKKLQEYPPKDVLGRLEVVFTRLDSNQQETFMYIACFLKGRDMDLVKDILSNIGLYSECGITDLMNKFLITINLDDCVWMHDLLQQMCWEILRKKSHIFGGIHFAIKYFQDIVEVLLLKPKESSTIRIINQEKVEMDDSIDDPYCFSIMRRLKFLRISNVRFPQGLSYLSNDLRILEWFECSLKSFPSNFKPAHMYELEMCYSQLETLWEETLVFPNLRSIDLSFSKELIKIPDLTSTPKLVKLNLEGCTKLKELHESVLLQKSLQYMNLTGCTHLQCLGGSNIEMEALVTLLLSGCSNLEYIPEFGQNMKCLENLYLDGTNIKKLPESLGELHNLRKLDASETSIEEIPLSVRYLKRLRFLRAQRCPFSSQNKGFLFTKVDILSNIRELNLSYCNLSVIPDGIGLLHRLISLDLSGNDFVHLPGSISLLSNLKMLFLNNCKRFQSVPKLSIVNEDTISGLPIRFNYIMSGEEVDVSKFHAASNNTNPTISCLNCPNLAKSGSGCYLAENILHSYLQLRTKYWMTPVAVFEIVGAGSEISPGFVLPGSDDLIIKSPWIGVAICAVIAVDNIDAFIEDKYVITAHIRVGEKHWRISVPINFFVAGLENQLVIYWTVADDLDRLLDSRRQFNFRVSFSVEPGEGNETSEERS
ncbi:NB-ARC domains-containing protein [Artemisia annua]|uniref:NB-ARC domains-containing protein n=1 Tax=Artemisia annua TaxID=35608 RepID=A0A2U1LRA2_ARTAN|nr:NB-ARC domains-containing protein [Artemisia annua]